MTLDCKESHDRISDFVGGELSSAERGAMEAHLDGCGACRDRLLETEAAVRLIARLGDRAPGPGHADGHGDDELPAGFGAALHRKLVEVGQPPSVGLVPRLREWLAARAGWRPIAWGAMGAAASLLLVLALHRAPLGAPQHTPDATQQNALADGTVTPTFHVPAKKLAVIKIDFEADSAADDVAFAITLPEGLHFVSGGHDLPDRSIEWRGRLEEGSNLVPVAVRGSRPGLFTVAARVRGAGVEATHQVVLEVIAG